MISFSEIWICHLNYSEHDVTSMEHRVRRFYELHNNKWFHIMNVSLEIIRIEDKEQKYMIMKYGYVFFNLALRTRPAIQLAQHEEHAALLARPVLL